MGLSAFTLLALIPTLTWGLADFVAGTRTADIGATDTVAGSQVVSAVIVCVVAVPVTGGIDGSGALPAALGGAAGVVGLACFYRGMQVAPVAIVAPIVASGVGLPVLYGLVVDGVSSASAVVGLCLGVLGIAALSTARSAEDEANRAINATGLLLAAAGAAGYGAFLIGIAASSHDHPLDATVLARLGAVAIALPILVRPRGREGRRRLLAVAWRVVAVIGLLDAAGVLAFAAATSHDHIAASAVLASFYPAVTVALAVRYTQYVWDPRQRVGVALTLLAVPFLAAG